MPAPIEVRGLAEFRRDLNQLEEAARWKRELGQEQRAIAVDIAGKASFRALAMGGPQAHFADAIKGRGGVAGARVQISDPDANAAFWGAKQRTGWNAGNDTPNQPLWVTNSWDAWLGEGPYAIAPTIRDMADEIVEMYAAGVERVATSVSACWPATF